MQDEPLVALWVFVSSQIRKLLWQPPKDMVLEGRSFERWLGHDGGPYTVE